MLEIGYKFANHAENEEQGSFKDSLENQKDIFTLTRKFSSDGGEQ